jgi:hypothetical protein
MGTLKQLRERLSSIDENVITGLAIDLLFEMEDDLLYAQKNQLAAGQDLAGNFLKPTILEDPYFKGSKKWAQWWIANKSHPPSDFGTKPDYIANLIFSTGDIVWNHIRVVYTDSEVYIMPEDIGLQNELEEKYGPVFGLNPKGRAYILDTAGFRGRFLQRFRNVLFNGYGL